jgi:hypothetical protein
MFDFEFGKKHKLRIKSLQSQLNTAYKRERELEEVIESSYEMARDRVSEIVALREKNEKLKEQLKEAQSVKKFEHVVVFREG